MKNIISVIILSLISILLFAALCAILPSISAFDPIERVIDEIAVTDLYYSSIRNRRAVDNDKFLILDTSPCTRSNIAQAVSRSANAGAPVIGIDVIFSHIDTDSAGTRQLQTAVENANDVAVIAIHLNQWDEADKHYISTVHSALDSMEVRTGYTNLVNHSDNSYIRNYSIAAPGETPSFAQAIASDYLRIFGAENDFEPTSEGIIDLTPQKFMIVDARDMQAIDSLAAGRIVLLGALNADEDIHFTPVGTMSGVLVQAYTIDTLLNNPTIIPPTWLVWLFCAILTMFASWGFIVLRNSFEVGHTNANRLNYAALGLGNLVYPTLTILLTIFIIGEVYVVTDCYIPPLVIVGSLALIPVAYDIISIVTSLFCRR